MLVAVDLGYGRIKAEAESKRLNYPSLVSDFNGLAFTSGEETSDDLDRLAVEYEGEKFFLGEMARRQGAARATLDQDRFIDLEGMALLAGTLTRFTKPGKQVVNLVAGLPVTFYAKMEDTYKKAIQGKHEVTILTPDGKEGENYTFRIDEIRLMPQPFGSIFNELLSEDGGIEKPSYGTGNVGVIDIGYNTLDLCRADELEFIERKSRSFSNTGMHSAYVEISKSLYEAFKVEVSEEHLENAVRERKFKAGGRVYDINNIIETAYKNVAERVVSKIRNTWNDLWNVDRILITGGGAPALGDYIGSALEHEGVVICNDDAIYTNVRGYYKYGRRKQNN